MKPAQFTLTLASVLFGSLMGSCNMDRTPTEPADMNSAQHHVSLPTMARAEDGMTDQLRAGCPMVVEGADVTVTDTEGGVALTFTTNTGDVADLRARVQQMAQMYGMHSAQAGMMWHHMAGAGRGHGGPGMSGEGMVMGPGGPGMGGEGMRHGGPGMGHGGPGMGGEGMGHVAGRDRMPAATATAADTESGARIELRPSDAAQLGALRDHVRGHAQRMHSGECWMLDRQTTATATGAAETSALGETDD